MASPRSGTGGGDSGTLSFGSSFIGRSLTESLKVGTGFQMRELRCGCELALQFLIIGEQGRSTLPDLCRIVGAPGFLVLVAEPGVGPREMWLWGLRFLLLNQRLELFDHF